MCIQQVDSLKKQLEALCDKVHQRQEEVIVVAAKIEEVNDNLRRTRTSVDRASAELDMHEPIGRDLKAIKGQQEDLKVSIMITVITINSTIDPFC